MTRPTASPPYFPYREHRTLKEADAEFRPRLPHPLVIDKGWWPGLRRTRRAACIITLPFPDKRLSPNARVHRMVRAALVKKARADAHFLTLEAAGYRLGTIRAILAEADRIPVHIGFRPPDNRPRDIDNMLSAAKGALDGLADALHANDRKFELTLTRLEPRKPGAVEVTVG